MGSRFVVLSGCSGGGKSSLLQELSQRGYHIVEEPGRRIVHAEIAAGGSALPWIDLAAFARKAIELATNDLVVAERFPGWVFFDRGIVDATVALQHATTEAVFPVPRDRYHHKVFLVPPWQEIYVMDAERRHGFQEAEMEFKRLLVAYQDLGYEVQILPKESVQRRADLVLSLLSLEADHF